MMKRWWEYQNALKPASLSNGFGRSTLFLLNHGDASVKAMAIRTTITIPVTPSHPFTKNQ